MRLCGHRRYSGPSARRSWRSPLGRPAPDRPSQRLVREGKPVDDGDEAQVLAAYAKLPLAFTSRTPASSTGASATRPRPEATRASSSRARRPVRAPGRARGSRARLRFLGANPASAITGARPGPGRVNYLLGGDPAHWRTSCRPTERSSTAASGRGSTWPPRRGRQLKYEFPRPGPASRIRLAYRGQERLSLGRSGELRIETALGACATPAPLATRSRQRVAVESRFVLEAAAALRLRCRSRTTAATRSSSTRASSTPPSWAEAAATTARHRGRRRRQRLRDREHGLGRLPDDRGRLRHDLQRRLTTPS